MIDDGLDHMPDDDNKPTQSRQHAAEIVAAYVRHHRLSADQLGSLISAVHHALGQLGKSAEAVVERTPAVPIRRSVQHDRVTCLECGWAGSMLRRHITAAHNLSVEDYRARWNLTATHGMTAPAYSERRSTMAKQIGLGRGGESRQTPDPAASAAPAAAQPRRRGRPRSVASST